jgi:hypothetical protein
MGKAGLLGCTPAALARDQLKSRPNLPNDERLNDTVLPDGIDQFLQCVPSKIFARLQRARDDAYEVNLVNSFARLDDIFSWRGRGSANECAETFAKTGPRHAAEATGTASLTQTAAIYFACTALLGRDLCLSSDPNTITNSIGYAKFNSRSHDAVIRVYDGAGNALKTREHAGQFKEW